jgi:hypothetical protein
LLAGRGRDPGWNLIFHFQPGSRSRLARTDFEPLFPDVAARGNDPVYFRFFDATAQAMFLYRAIEQTVRLDEG